MTPPPPSPPPRSHPASAPRKRRRRSMPALSPARAATWTALLVLLSLPLGLAAKDDKACLKVADEVIINALLSDGGPGAKIRLCKSQTYNLSNPIIFTAKDQEIFTDGYPENDDEKATLMVVGGPRGVAIQGDCRRCARVTISHLNINGNRLLLGRLPNPDFPELIPILPTPPTPSRLTASAPIVVPETPEAKEAKTQPRVHPLPPPPTAQDLELGTALVMLGNNEGQRVKHCTLRDPRGWTAIQVREGDKLSCSGAVIEHNTIGPAGEQWDEAIDGESPELSPYGRPLADGLSLACRDSFVKRNTFIDTTDAAINIHCSPGSEIAHNSIFTTALTQMAGILMISSTPFSSDYTDLLVHSNVLSASASALMRVGIGIGTPIWSDDSETVLFGGTVLGNLLKGEGMGYGIAVSGVEDWKIVENESEAWHGGKMGKRCLVEVEEGERGWESLSEREKKEGVVKNPRPVAFLRNEETSSVGEYQEEFEDARDFSYLICIDPEDPASVSLPEDDAQKPFTVDAEREEKQPDAPSESVKPEEKSVMNSILSHSQSRMLQAISDLGERVEALSSIRGGLGGMKLNGEGPEILSSLAGLSTRIAALETERKMLAKTMEEFGSTLKSLGQGMDRFETHETDLLSEIYELIKSPSRRSAPITHPETPISNPIRQLHGSWIRPFFYLFGIQGLLGLLALLWQKCMVKSKGGKRF